MAYTDFLAAIDLGTSQIVGMVGIKNLNGSISIIACETEESNAGIRRGCVFNIDETANRVKGLVRKLENKLSGGKIQKVYVGIGGQSLRTIDHSVVKELNEDEVVTEGLIDALYLESKNYKPELMEVLSVTSPTYLLDDKTEINPVGVPCKRIDARFKLVVGRPSLKRYVDYSIADKAKKEVAGILVSPLALADVVLSEDEKNLGCALIDFGAGVTSVTVFKNGKLIDLSVIPFGSQLITRDIMSLHITESEAERIKLAYGSAIADREDTSFVQVASADGSGMREIKLAELNNVVEARAKEIVENVAARLESTGIMNDLGAGLVLAGKAAALKNLQTLIGERLGLEVRPATVRKGIVDNDRVLANKSDFAATIGLLMRATENCALVVAEPPQTPSDSLFPEDEIETKEKEPKKPKKPKGEGFFQKINKKISNLGGEIDNLGKGLFDE